MGPGSKQASLAAGLCPQSWTNRLLPASSSEDKWICRCGACNGHRGQSLGSDTACRFFCVRRGACGLAFPVKRHCKASLPRAGDARNQSIHDLSAKSVGAENALATTQGVDAAPVPPSLREALMEGLPVSLPGGPFSVLVAGYGPRDRSLSVGAKSAVVTGVSTLLAPADAPDCVGPARPARGRQGGRGVGKAQAVTTGWSASLGWRIPAESCNVSHAICERLAKALANVRWHHVHTAGAKGL